MPLMIVLVCLAVICFIMFILTSTGLFNKLTDIYNKKERDIDFCGTKEGGLVRIRKRSSKYRNYFSIEEAHNYYIKNEPVKLHYGSATVGKVTTGGFYTTGGQKTLNRGVKAPDKYILYYKGKIVNEIFFNDLHIPGRPLITKAKQDKIISKYITNENNIIVVPTSNNIPVSSVTQSLFLQTGNYQFLMNDIINSYPSKEKCQDIIDWICQDD